MQRVEVIGNITKDVELKKVTSKDKEYSVATLSVAINGASEDDTLFVEFEVWEKLAENCAKYLQKGSKVFVEATMENNNYEKDGVKHFGLRFRARNVEFLTPKKD